MWSDKIVFVTQEVIFFLFRQPTIDRLIATLILLLLSTVDDQLVTTTRTIIPDHHHDLIPRLRILSLNL